MKKTFFFLLLMTANVFAKPITADAFSMSATSCYGTCPAYKVTVFSDGVIVFEGEAFTKSEGIHRLPGNPDLFQEIVTLLDNSNFNDFLDNYGWTEKSETNPCNELWTDSPSTILTIQFANTKKTVYHYHGCAGFEREEELEALQKNLFEILGLKNYVGQ